MTTHTFVDGTVFGVDASLKVRCPHGDTYAMHPRVPEIKPHVFTTQYVDSLRRLMTDPDGDILVSYGSSGKGKTSGIRQYAARTMWPLYEWEGSRDTSFQLDLIGRSNPGTGVYVSGPLRDALLTGGIFMLNEPDVMDPGELVKFYELLTNGIEDAETGEWLATALIDRFIPIDPNELDDGAMLLMCQQKIDTKVSVWNDEYGVSIPNSTTQSVKNALPDMIKVMRDINEAVDKSQQNDFTATNGVSLDKEMSPRALLRWCREMLRVSPTTCRNRLKKTLHEAYLHKLVAEPEQYDAVIHLAKSVFGIAWVED
jgi:cobaltochelatase CobS